MGSIDFNKPERTDPALDIIENIRNSFRELGKLLGDTTIANPFDGLIKLNPTTRRLEKYDGTGLQWVEWLPKDDDTVPYDIRAAVANHADTADAAGEAGTAGACTGDCTGTASNATNLDGKAASDYRLKSEKIGVTEGGTGAGTAGEARTALDLLQKSANGDDIPNKSTFRGNIGLTPGETARGTLGFKSGALTEVGSVATLDYGQEEDEVPLCGVIPTLMSGASVTLQMGAVFGSTPRSGTRTIYPPSGAKFVEGRGCEISDDGSSASRSSHDTVIDFSAIWMKATIE